MFVQTAVCTNFPDAVNNPNSYRGADMSLARPTSRCILFDGENISFDASLVIYRVGHEKVACLPFAFAFGYSISIA